MAEPPRGQVDQEPQGPYPLAGDAAWHGLRDALLLLLVQRSLQRGLFTFGDAYDERFVDHLRAVRTEGRGDKDLLLGGVYNLASDLGRHVYAKAIYEDTLPGATVTLSTLLLQSGLGVIHCMDSFHRRAELRFEPSEGLEDLDQDVLEAFTMGLVHGVYTTAFNSEADLERLGPAHYAIRLTRGRDVNEHRHRRKHPGSEPGSEANE